MRRDLLHWDQALLLAQKVAPAEEAEIAFRYAQQLEFKGEYEKGLGAVQSHELFFFDVTTPSPRMIVETVVCPSLLDVPTLC
jgi:hypothetical protein